MPDSSQHNIKKLEKTILSSLSIPSNHLTLGLTNLIHSNKALLSLINHRRLPDIGWSDLQIQSLLLTLSTLDTNHESSLMSQTGGGGDGNGDGNGAAFNGRWVGVGEREGRVYSNLVMSRHWGMSHGIGRSGDVTEPQPKAVGSSILSQLTKWFVLDVMKRGSGLKGDRKNEDPAKYGLVLPLCTGMSMALILSSLRESAVKEAEADALLVAETEAEDVTLSGGGDDGSSNNNDDNNNIKGESIKEKEKGDSTSSSSLQKNIVKDVVLWSRIDQKSCFKAVLSAGLKCIVVPTTMESNSDDDSVITDMQALRECMDKYKDNLLAVISTTSCFAPRVPDKIDEIAKLCQDRNVSHVINNAYGLQCQSVICKLINRACVIGRVDAIVCSTDKNFLVPVGGAIVISPKETMIQKLGKIYAGRASSAPILDLFITLLSLGLNGYKNLLERRRKLTIKFQEKLSTIAQNQGERILKCPKNTISFGITLDTLAKDLGVDEKKNAEITSLFGSMLFTRCVSGTRVVSKNQIKIIAGQEFIGFGSSTDGYPHSYLTAACAIGLSEVEMEEFFVRLEKCFKDFRSKMMKKLSSSSSVTGGLKTAE